MKSKAILWIVVGVLVVVAGFLVFKPSGGQGIVNVDTAGAKQAISAGAQIVDVRTPGEFQMGHIKGAINVPVDQLAAQAASWNKDASYVVYCATGARSATAVETMRSLGFKNISHLAAGVQAWDEPLETGGQSSDQTIETAGKPVMVEFYTDS